MKDIVSIMGMRNNEDTFEWFMNNIIPCVVGKENFSLRVLKLPSTWVMVSSEAFALLCMENYHDHILDIANHVPNKRSSKYTADGCGAKKNQGWNKEGLQRFKALVHLLLWIVRQMTMWRRNIGQVKRKRRREKLPGNKERGYGERTRRWLWGVYEDETSVEENTDNQDENKRQMENDITPTPCLPVKAKLDYSST